MGEWENGRVGEWERESGRVGEWENATGRVSHSPIPPFPHSPILPFPHTPTLFHGEPRWLQRLPQVGIVVVIGKRG